MTRRGVHLGRGAEVPVPKILSHPLSDIRGCRIDLLTVASFLVFSILPEESCAVGYEGRRFRLTMVIVVLCRNFGSEQYTVFTQSEQP